MSCGNDFLLSTASEYGSIRTELEQYPNKHKPATLQVNTTETEFSKAFIFRFLQQEEFAEEKNSPQVSKDFLKKNKTNLSPKSRICAWT